jgi:GH25 family lysozyme M1 (1,4-beta-N-acetylmuramidase)
MLNGIDVSGWNPSDYPTRGEQFVFVKATEGVTYVNPKQQAQTATARAAGLVLGFYHFLHPGNIKAQAAFFVDRCLSVQGDMLVCDWETPQGGKGATNAEKDAFLREVKRLRPGHRVGLYCNTDYWKNRDTTSYAADFLWIADPNHAPGQPNIKASWRFHQHSITGNIDQNVARFDSPAALRKWCGYPAAPAPGPAPAPAPKGTAYDVRQDARISALEKKMQE